LNVRGEQEEEEEEEEEEKERWVEAEWKKAIPLSCSFSHLSPFFSQTQNEIRQVKGGEKELVLRVEIVKKQSIMGYHGNALRSFLCITLSSPRLVPTCRGKKWKEERMSTKVLLSLFCVFCLQAFWHRNNALPFRNNNRR
jgi:hypothetical protein